LNKLLIVLAQEKSLRRFLSALVPHRFTKTAVIFFIFLLLSIERQ